MEVTAVGDGAQKGRGGKDNILAPEGSVGWDVIFSGVCEVVSYTTMKSCCLHP